MAIDYQDPRWLQRAMEQAGLTARQLADATGISKSQINRLRDDASKTRASTAQRLVNAIMQAA